MRPTDYKRPLFLAFFLLLALLPACSSGIGDDSGSGGVGGGATGGTQNMEWDNSNWDEDLWT